MNALERAKQVIGQATPMKRDCGELCGAACCGTDGDGQGGVWLYPGEEMRGCDWCRVEARDGGNLVVCTGECNREMRPFGCRIFPLAPFKKKDGTWSARIDARAKGLCPIAVNGVNGLDPAFVRAVKSAIRILSEDAEALPYLRARQAEEDAYRADQKEIRELLKPR